MVQKYNAFIYINILIRTFVNKITVIFIMFSDVIPMK
jgi:hypothetical protein